MAQCFLLKGLLKHFMCFCGHFTEMETKSQADSLFGTVRHHNFMRGAWHHLGELTTQARTTFYGNAYLATDSWRVQLHSPSGEHSTTITKSSPKPVWFFWVPPHIYIRSHTLFCLQSRQQRCLQVQGDQDPKKIHRIRLLPQVSTISTVTLCH